MQRAELMDKDKLTQKWLLDDLNVEEAKAFEALEEASFYKDIVEGASQFKASNYSKMDDFETFKKRMEASETPVRKLHWTTPLLRIASVIFIAFGAYYFFLSDNLLTVQTKVAEKTTIELPDTSKVILNAGSEVAYDEKEWASNRKIELKGEAFFDVAKGAKFEVFTEKGTVTVLGTEFNVKQRGSYFEVACFEGIVRVTSGNETKILKVGDNFRLFNGEVISGKHAFESPKWTNNVSHFNRIAVSEVFAEFERQYGIALTLENVDTEQLFTGSFMHDNLENALLAISEPLGLDYEIINTDTVRLSMSGK